MVYTKIFQRCIKLLVQINDEIVCDRFLVD